MHTNRELRDCRVHQMSRDLARFSRKTGELTTLIVCVFVLIEREAHAYLEPGSFNFFLQTLIGAILGGAIFIKLSWRRLKVAVGRLFSSEQQEDEREEES